MDNERIKDLFNLVFTQKATLEERDEFLDLLVLGENEDLAKSLIFESFRNNRDLSDIGSPSEEHILQAIFQAEKVFEPNPVKKSRVQWLAVAASITIVFSIGLFYFLSHSGRIGEEKVRFAADHNPGKDRATLVLGDGRTISLDGPSTGTIADQSGVHLKRSGNLLSYDDSNISAGNRLYNEIITPKGGQYMVKLPDGTQVWLNAASKLRYPVSFANNEQRRVELSGEAYFEVAKDKRHPFLVQTRAQQIEVLGTHFNVNSYTDETALKTTLIEGKVRVSPIGKVGVNAVVLLPGQQSVLAGNKIHVHRVDTDEAVSWHMGYFMFHRETLDEIMRKVSRWYDVEIVYDDPSIKDISFSGSVGRFDKVSKLLRMLEMTEKVYFEIENKRITVYQNNN